MKALLWFPAPVQSLDWSWALLCRAAPIQLLDWSWMKDFSGVRHSPITGWELEGALLWCAAPVQLLDWELDGALLWRAAPVQLLDWSWMKHCVRGQSSYWIGAGRNISLVCGTSPVTGLDLDAALLWRAPPIQLLRWSCMRHTRERHQHAREVLHPAPIQ